jgi:hypothetical protein
MITSSSKYDVVVDDEEEEAYLDGLHVGLIEVYLDWLFVCVRVSVFGFLKLMCDENGV